MQRRNDRSALVRQRAKKPEDLQLMLRIEVVCRFIEEKYGGLLRQQCCDGHASLFAAGQRIHSPGRETLEPDSGQGAVRELLIRRTLPLPQGQMGMPADQHRLENGHGESVLEILHQQAHAPRDGPARETG